MDSNNNLEGSQRLKNLAQQLISIQKSFLPLDHTDNKISPSEDPTIQVTKGKSFPQDLDLNTKSVTNPISNQADSSRSNRAAVLICIFEGQDGDFRVILTKRSSTLSINAGDVALPGGKTEEGDANEIDTALREAKEEIGLDPSLVNVVTILEPFTTKRGITVVPVIGILYDKKAFKPVPSPAEVEAIFDAPLEMFLKDENRRAEEREWLGDKYLLHFFDYEADNKKYVIWALTAGILIKAASIV